jgi:uncharacterized protein
MKQHKLKWYNLSRIGMKYPVWVMLGILVMTGLFATRFPQVTFDNSPENMLSKDEPVRLRHQAVKEQFQLYDFVVVGVVNEGETGVWNPETLARVDHLTRQLLSLRQVDGKPVVDDFDLQLAPEGQRAKVLAAAFKQDPERLFDEKGESAIIKAEIIAPSVVDTIRQLESGMLDVRFLMQDVPQTQAEADDLFAEALSNPLYRNTMVSEDGKALGIYLPILEKTYSYNVANLVKTLTVDWPESDQVYITGLPVAEDTFGVEMLVQMATSAPMAGLMIFLLLLWFFRKPTLIIAPMIVAIVSVICSMGLLIGLGYDVHIMSSMIAIFLMPIAVADSVHILSEFYDTWPQIRDKRATIEKVMSHLFMPMLFTSLTTMAGFASLAMTPIPPVKVFGLHVAFGVALAWLLSVTMIPAYIILFVREKSLEANAQKTDKPAKAKKDVMGAFLQGLGHISVGHWKAVLTGMLLLAGLAFWGISKIVVNDNPVLWFTPSHRIRVADKVLNKHFGGTYTAYLTLEAPTLSDDMSPRDLLTRAYPDLKDGSAEDTWPAWQVWAQAQDAEQRKRWDPLLDALDAIDPQELTPTTLRAAWQDVPGIDPALRAQADKILDAAGVQQGDVLWEMVQAGIEEAQGFSWRDAVNRVQAEAEAPAFKRPDVLAWVESLQIALAEGPSVGKSTSVADALKKTSYELQHNSETGDFEKYYRIPQTVQAAGQFYIQLTQMKKQDSLYHLVTRDYENANIWLQLRSGDNQKMLAAVAEVDAFVAANPPPMDLKVDWAGLTYINVVWQEKMVGGMLEALAGSFVVVLLMMIFLFRSFIFGLLSMLPLLLTISLTYGLIGWLGKAYDMPVAVLSSLTLGMSVDFAIHFLQRARELVRQQGSWTGVWPLMFAEPAKAISRNAIVIAVGFTPLLLAPLMPYKTVGFLLATIMFMSWLATLVLLAALLTGLQRFLFKSSTQEKSS